MIPNTTSKQKNKMKQKFYLLGLLILFANAGFSQPVVNDSVQLGDLIVTGTKTEVSRKIVPLSVSQISQTNIENSNQHNILPLLNQFAPGIFVTERNILGFGVATGGSGGISIRGISSAPNTSVLVLIDGHPQYQGIFGHPLPDAYVASDVEKVEIIRGPASILYGSNAMAGVINIITKKQKEEGLKLSAGASYGSYNTQKYYGTIGYKKDKLSVFASVNHDQTDGIRDKTNFNISNGYAKAGYELSKHFSMNADYSIARYNANDNGTIYVPAPFNIDITRGKAAFSLDNKFENADGSLKFYHNFGEHILSDGFQSTDRNSGIMLYETFRLLENNSITIGTDMKQYGGIANRGAAANQFKTVNELSLYAYTQQLLLRKLTLSGGLRLENNSVYGNELIPMIGLSYVHNSNTSFKASASKGFRSPTVMELYVYPTPNPVNFPNSNPDLLPERLMNYEIGWLQALLKNKLQLELTAFLVKGENLIQMVPPPVAMRQNIGSFNNKGIEFSGKYFISKNLMLHGNYSFVDLEKAVLAAPRQQANISANYHYSIWNFNLSAQHIDGLYTQISPAPITESYTLVNARVSVKPIKILDVFISANNLLNQQYEINYGYPMPGINFNGGFNVRF
jgi:iron complex outermembrane receptor protein